jgi:hypothetical protein
MDWRPTRSNTSSIAGFKAMHGGPVGMCLAEHQHIETQLEVHFWRPGGKTSFPVPARGYLPQDMELIPPGQPHIGGWESDSEVIVVLIPRLFLNARPTSFSSDPNLWFSITNAKLNRSSTKLRPAFAVSFILVWCKQVVRGVIWLSVSRTYSSELRRDSSTYFPQ